MLEKLVYFGVDGTVTVKTGAVQIRGRTPVLGSGRRVCVCVCVCISVLAKLSQSQYSNSLFDITTQHFFPIRIKLATSLADRGVPVDDENIVNASLCSVRRICEMYIFIVRRSVKYGLPVAVTVLEEKRSNRNFRINL